MMFADPLPDRLYHYTDVGGLYGILKDQELWATHVGYLNDSREFHLGMDLIKQRVKQMPAPRPRDPISGLIGSGVMTGLKQNFEMLSEKIPEEAGPYVACLSAAGDQLSQWRGYGAGGGYAICFDTNLLQQQLDSYTPQVEPVFEGVYALPLHKQELGRVIYYAKEAQHPVGIDAIPLIDERITALANKFQTSMDSMVDIARGKLPMPEHPDREMQAQLSPDMVHLLNLAACIKHNGFEEEREHRIVTFRPPELFSPSEIGLIPRVKIKFTPLCVNEIRIGPGQHMATRESSVRAYLHRNQDRYAHVGVCRSDIPFTGM